MASDVPDVIGTLQVFIQYARIGGNREKAEDSFHLRGRIFRQFLVLEPGAARSWASTSRQGWRGWDTVEAEIPQSELHDLIVELRSLTQGVGTYEQKFHHLAELTGKLAENVVAERKSAA